MLFMPNNVQIKLLLKACVFDLGDVGVSFVFFKLPLQTKNDKNKDVKDCVCSNISCTQ